MTRLDETLAWYEVVRASWALADRVVREYPEAVPEGSPFRNQATYEAVRLLESSAAEIDDLTVLALTSFSKSWCSSTSLSKRDGSGPVKPGRRWLW